MRLIFICDHTSNILRQEGYCRLEERIQTATYRCINQKHQDELLILAQLWEYHYGPEGEALLSSSDLNLLLKDIEYLKPLLKDIEPGRIKAAKTELQEIEAFFDDLRSLCQKAQTKNFLLKIEAD